MMRGCTCMHPLHACMHVDAGLWAGCGRLAGSMHALPPGARQVHAQLG